MEFLADLWLPIVLSAVYVFIASSIIHMASPMHKSDYRAIPNEDQVLAHMRENGISTGSYAFPFTCSMKEMGSPEMQEKYKRGPVGFLTVLPEGGFQMGPSLIAWFVYSLVIGVFVAYLSSLAVKPDAEYLEVFRIAGTIAVLGYSMAPVPDSIWKGQSWGTTFRFILDGLIYGLGTAGVFSWLWPSGA